MRATGVDHLVLTVADVERTLGWYEEHLGLEPLRVDEWRKGDAPFPSVRITPTTIIDLFGRDFAGAPDGTNVDHVCLVIEPAVRASIMQATIPARSKSAVIITFLRRKRSLITPAVGPTSACGSTCSVMARPTDCALPVSCSSSV